MPDRIPRKCNAPGCPNFGVYAGGYCPDHLRTHEVGRKKPKLNIYDARWEQLKKLLRGYGNTVCQRIGPCPGEDRPDVRCTNPVYFFHHIIDAEAYPHLAHDQRHIVGVCKSCHPAPGAGDQGVYVPTLWRTPMTNEELPAPLCLPGEAVTREQKALLWSLAERRAALGV